MAMDCLLVLLLPVLLLLLPLLLLLLLLLLPGHDGPPTGHRRATAKAINKSISIFQTTEKTNFHFWKLIPDFAFPKVRNYLHEST